MFVPGIHQRVPPVEVENCRERHRVRTGFGRTECWASLGKREGRGHNRVSVCLFAMYPYRMIGGNGIPPNMPR